MTLNGSKSPKDRVTDLLKISRPRVKRLQQNFTTIFASSVLLLFFLYIPFIHEPLNAGVEHTGPDVPFIVASQYGQSPANAYTPYTSSASVKQAVETETGEMRPAANMPYVSTPGITGRAQDFENSPPEYELNTGADSLRGDSAWSQATAKLRLPADITRGDKDSRMLSITFDGGFSANEATVILDELRKRGIKTTIFLTGTFMQLHPDITMRIVEDGHEVGNHTATHPHLTDYSSTYRHNTLETITRSVLIKELRSAEKLFTSITGYTMAPLWRAPYGEVNKELRTWAFEFGYLHIGWTYERKTKESLDTLDWVSEPGSRFYLTKEEILKRVVGFGEKSGGAGGGIVLMHLGTQRKDDRASGVLGSMLDGLSGRGYRFVTVSAMLGNNRALKTAFRKKTIRSYKKLSNIR